MVWNCPNNVKLLLGDFNAQVGYEEQDNIVVGKNGLHKESNNTGTRLIGLASSLNMVIGSTTFPQKRIHLETWRSPGDRTSNQIDHVLIDARHKTNMMDVRSYRGANMDTDHYLVVTRVRAKINMCKYNLKKDEIERCNIEKIKQPKTKREYDQQIKLLCSQIGNKMERNIEEEWTSLEEILKLSADEKIGYMEKNKRNRWFDTECEQATNEKNRKYKNLIQKKFTRVATEEYRDARRKEKRIHKMKKKELYEKELAWLQECDNKNESRKFYKQIIKMREGFQVKNLSCKNAEGEIIRDDKEVLKRWKEYFQSMYGNTEDEVDDNHANGAHTVEEEDGEKIVPPTREEIKESITKLKNNKESGPDGLIAELFKVDSNEYVDRVWRLMKRVWKEETFPSKWEEGLICPIYKKGDRLQCWNYPAKCNI